MVAWNPIGDFPVFVHMFNDVRWQPLLTSIHYPLKNTPTIVRPVTNLSKCLPSSLSFAPSSPWSQPKTQLRVIAAFQPASHPVQNNAGHGSQRQRYEFYALTIRSHSKASQPDPQPMFYQPEQSDLPLWFRQTCRHRRLRKSRLLTHRIRHSPNPCPANLQPSLRQQHSQRIPRLGRHRLRHSRCLRRRRRQRRHGPERLPRLRNRLPKPEHTSQRLWNSSKRLMRL